MKVFRDEYWIACGGELYAAGDAGDTNHEGHALEHVRRRLLDVLGWDGHSEFIDDDTIENAVNEYIVEQLAELPTDDCYGWLMEHAGELKVERHLINAAFDKGWDKLNHTEPGDIRDYVMKYCGWCWCRAGWIGVWALDRETRERIRKGVLDIVEQEGDDEVTKDAELQVGVHTTGNRFYYTLQDMEDRNFGAGLDNNVHVDTGPSDALRRQEIADQHPVYKNVLGD